MSRMMYIVVYSGSGPNFSLYAAKMNPASDDDSVMDMIKMSNLLFPNDIPTTTNATPNNANDRCTSQHATPTSRRTCIHNAAHTYFNFAGVSHSCLSQHAQESDKMSVC